MKYISMNYLFVGFLSDLASVVYIYGNYLLEEVIYIGLYIEVWNKLSAPIDSATEWSNEARYQLIIRYCTILRIVCIA